MKYRKRPIEVEAIQWNGENVIETQDFCGASYCNQDMKNKTSIFIYTREYPFTIYIQKSNWLVKQNGKILVCDVDEFEKTYEAVE